MRLKKKIKNENQICKLHNKQWRTYYYFASFHISISMTTKENIERSSRKTPFTMKPKQLALKKSVFITEKYFPN